eukprot:3806810-Prymnesium_polylepis.1
MAGRGTYTQPRTQSIWSIVALRTCERRLPWEWILDQARRHKRVDCACAIELRRVHASRGRHALKLAEVRPSHE